MKILLSLAAALRRRHRLAAARAARGIGHDRRPHRRSRPHQPAPGAPPRPPHQRRDRDACGDLSNVDLHGKNAAQRCRADTRAQAAAQRSNAIAFTRRAGATTLAAQ